MKKVIIMLLVSTSLLSISCSKDKKVVKKNNETEIVTSTDKGINEEYKLQFGKLVSSNVTGTTLIIKAKIKPSANNKTTVSQNGFNVENLIHTQGADEFEKIQYWAVSDMSDGREEKVVSFTLNSKQIEMVKNKSLVGNKIVANATDVFIHPSLK